jgi:hypothetical protein
VLLQIILEVKATAVAAGAFASASTVGQTSASMFNRDFVAVFTPHFRKK